MSSNANIVLPSLSQWTQDHITALIKATSQSDLTHALDNFLSQDAVITVNGEKLSRDDFAKQIQSETFSETNATVTFLGTVEVPTNKDQRVEVIDPTHPYTTFSFQKIIIKNLWFGHFSFL